MRLNPLVKSAIAAAATVAAIGAQAAISLDPNAGFQATAYKTTAFSDSYDFTFTGGSYGLVTFSLFGGGITWDAGSALTITDAISTHTYTGAAIPLFDQQLTLSGPFTFTLTGTPVVKGGYTLAVEATTAPVPEPTSMAMLLAGLGAIGFVASRRKGQ
ncbi:MAG: PEP-CTERM sorting domain-containing protein [Burkholderiales bacterium]|nr:PEP-CTERM sorting domain-containing protein [Burkholderiales bacterium]